MNTIKKKTIFWIVLLAVIVLAAGLYLLLAKNSAGEAKTAEIWVNGEVYDTIDLQAVTIPYEFTITTDLGYNTIRVSHGAIEVAEADCSEQVCVNQGQITDSLIPITCLPHRIVIEIEEP